MTTPAPCPLPALIVDPDETCRCGISRAVADCGFDVTGVGTLEEAHGILRDAPPVVVVLDAKLADGRTGDLGVPSSGGGRGHTSWILVGREGRGQISRCALDVLPRPVDPVRLRRALGWVRERSELLDELRGLRDASRESEVRIPVGTSLAEASRRLTFATLDAVEGNKTRAAGVLGVSVKTLYNHLKKYEADR